MSATVTYHCNLCRRELNRQKPSSQYPDGWPLMWRGPGVEKPAPGAVLESSSKWNDAPIHLCQVCVQAVAKFAEYAKSIGALQS